MNAIQTNHLTKYYGKTKALEQLTLSVEQGSFYGLIGPNGAGKSTLIRLLLGLISPTEGSATIFGRDCSEAKLENLSEIGYLPSETFFYDDMRVRELLRLSAKLRKKDCSAEAEALCQRLELDPMRKIRELSLGNRKKVGIVCALQHRPNLYVLDEPTSGLDPLMQKEFYSILKERNEEGATVFLSSHVLSEIARHCTHAAVIREGKLLIADEVTRLGHTGVKRISFRGNLRAEELPFAKDLKIEGDVGRFLYDGDVRTLMQVLSTLELQDLNIQDPELDEVFLHYYEQGGAQE